MGSPRTKPQDKVEIRARKLAEMLADLQWAARDYAKQRESGAAYLEKAALESLSTAAVRWTKAVERARRAARG